MDINLMLGVGVISLICFLVVLVLLLIRKDLLIEELTRNSYKIEQRSKIIEEMRLVERMKNGRASEYGVDE